MILARSGLHIFTWNTPWFVSAFSTSTAAAEARRFCINLTEFWNYTRKILANSLEIFNKIASGSFTISVWLIGKRSLFSFKLPSLRLAHFASHQATRVRRACKLSDRPTKNSLCFPHLFLHNLHEKASCYMNLVNGNQSLQISIFTKAWLLIANFVLKFLSSLVIMYGQVSSGNPCTDKASNQHFDNIRMFME